MKGYKKTLRQDGQTIIDISWHTRTILYQLEDQVPTTTGHVYGTTLSISKMGDSTIKPVGMADFHSGFHYYSIVHQQTFQDISGFHTVSIIP